MVIDFFDFLIKSILITLAVIIVFRVNVTSTICINKCDLFSAVLRSNTLL